MRKIISLALIGSITFGAASTIEEYLAELESQAKKENRTFVGFDAKRGEKIFFSEHLGKKGKVVSCASCHTKDLTKEGENIFTGKKIAPLSPKAEPSRLSDIKKVKKWLRRNFKDVYRREGTAQEKGDVLLFILNTK